MMTKIEYLVKRKETFVMILVLLLFSKIQFLDSAYASSSPAEIPTYMVTTREKLGDLMPVNGSGYHGNYNFSNIGTLLQICPPEIAIFIHGWDASSDEAKEQLDRVKMSLENNTYHNIHLIGYSWRSDIEWINAKILANGEGIKLAQFISKLVQECDENTDIRLLAHSLGSRVILSSLNALNNISSGVNFKIASVHLMGAAVDDEEISKNPSDNNNSEYDDGIVYGDAIEKYVNEFYNLYNSEDDMLERRDPDEGTEVYPFFEKDDALGSWRIQNASINRADVPSNYNEINVKNEILEIEDADGDGECDIFPSSCIISTNDRGDNHLGYMGFRDNISKRIVGNGAMNIIACNWLVS